MASVLGTGGSAKPTRPPTASQASALRRGRRGSSVRGSVRYVVRQAPAVARPRPARGDGARIRAHGAPGARAEPVGRIEVDPVLSPVCRCDRGPPRSHRPQAHGDRHPRLVASSGAGADTRRRRALWGAKCAKSMGRPRRRRPARSWALPAATHARERGADLRAAEPDRAGHPRAEMTVTPVSPSFGRTATAGRPVTVRYRPEEPDPGILRVDGRRGGRRGSSRSRARGRGPGSGGAAGRSGQALNGSSHPRPTTLGTWARPPGAAS